MQFVVVKNTASTDCNNFHKVIHCIVENTNASFFIEGIKIVLEYIVDPRKPLSATTFSLGHNGQRRPG